MTHTLIFDEAKLNTVEMPVMSSAPSRPARQVQQHPNHIAAPIIVVLFCLLVSIGMIKYSNEQDREGRMLPSREYNQYPATMFIFR